ncbi:MAG: nuclear transport factor 2 family protein [Phycisphaerales bacterium]|nr:MAG: nuclear transport factor 2 family protein [Phycisphaerales bacterium]
MADPNAELARKYLEAWSAGELDTVRSMLTNDVEVHIPGRTPLAGVYRNASDFFGYIDKVLDLTGGKTERIEILDILANDERAAAITRVRFRRPGKNTECRRFFTFDIRDGRIYELWVFDEDQYVVDEFFS